MCVYIRVCVYLSKWFDLAQSEAFPSEFLHHCLLWEVIIIIFANISLLLFKIEKYFLDMGNDHNPERSCTIIGHCNTSKTKQTKYKKWINNKTVNFPER